MFYPIRWVRRQRSLAEAKQRLHQKYRLNCLKRINRRKYPKQPVTQAKHKVRFTSQSEICHYDVKVCFSFLMPENIGIAHSYDGSKT